MSWRRGADRRPGREDGHEHVTPVVDTAKCKWCAEPIAIRAEGRTRQYCDPTCRAAAHRKSQWSVRKRRRDS